MNIKLTTKSTRRTLASKPVAAAFPFASTEPSFEIFLSTSITASYDIHIARRDSARAVHVVRDRFLSISEFSVYYHTKFKLYRNKLNHLIKKISKVNYYRRYFSSNTTHIKNIWKGIKQIIALKPLCNNIPTKLLVSNNEITDTYHMANSFNDFFANVANNLVSNLPPPSYSPLSFMPNCTQVQLVLMKSCMK